MIIVNNIQGSPESVPSTYKKIFITSDSFIFFDTEQEYDSYIEALPKIAKSIDINLIYSLHDELFKSYYIALGYVDWAEINSAIYSKYKEEAEALIKWYWDTWDIVEVYTLNPTNELTEQEFINSLPIFEYNSTL